VTDDCAADHPGGEDRAERNRFRIQQQNARDHLNNTAADPAPWLHPELAENVDRFLGAGELEEQRLEQDRRDDQLENPTDDVLTAGYRLRALHWQLLDWECQSDAG